MSKTRIPLPAVERQRLALKLVAERMDMPIAETGLSVRTVNGLEEHGIFLVRDLLQQSREDLLNFPNFGEKTVADILDKLRDLGFGKSP